MKVYRILIVSIVFLCFNGRVYSSVWYVHPDSSLNSIQAALDSCSSGDTVLVAPGIYYENIIWPSINGIDLISESGPDITIIDGGDSGSVITIWGYFIDTTTVIRGFTIQNGFASTGGGISISDASPLITENIIKNNTATLGGGLYGFWSSALVVNNTIENNSASFGGGIMFSFTDFKIGDSNWEPFGLKETLLNGQFQMEKEKIKEGSVPYAIGNIIIGNTAEEYGGGIAVWFYGGAYIQDNIISENTATRGGGIASVSIGAFITGNSITANTAQYGGGIYSTSIIIEIQENTISGNMADYGGGLFFGGYHETLTVEDNTIASNTANYNGAGINCVQASPSISNCTISNNYGDGIYCEGSSATIHVSRIVENTGYGILNVDSTHIIDAIYNWWGDPSGPSGVGPGSGDEVSEWVDYEPWLTEPTYIPGDANGDGVVNTADLSYLANYLYFNGPEPEPLLAGDANGDCEVNTSDLSYLANYLYFEGPEPQYCSR
jgi:hypothetical protein